METKRLLFLLIFAVLCPSGWAEKWYVSPAGSDEADGRSQTTAWHSVQKAAEALQPGDELILLPGEYSGRAVVKVKGTKEKPVVIRAEKPGFSVLRGWEAVSGFEKVAGTRFIWKTPVKKAIYRVYEVDSRTNLLKAPAVHDMDLFRGSFLYDEAEGMLYLHTSDGLPPDMHTLRATVDRGYGLQVLGSYVTVEGLTVTGYYPGDRKEGGHGFGILVEGEHHTVRGCTLMYNGGGIKVRARDTLLEGNWLEGNVDASHNEMAQIYVTRPSQRVMVRGNVVLDGATHGIRFYGGASDVAAVDNVIKGSRIGLYFKASGGAREAQGNVVLESGYIGFSTGENKGPFLEDGNTFGSPSYWNSVNQANPGTGTLLLTEKDDPRFCAPEMLDFRLQADSAMLGRGAHPKPAEVFFVDTAGSDEANGASERTPLKTLGAALTRAGAGSTIYLSAGTHLVSQHLNASGTADQPITIRGRGERATTIAGGRKGVKLSGVRHLRLENLVLEREAGLVKCEDVVLDRIRTGKLKVERSRTIWLRRSTLEDGATFDRRCRDVRVTSSVLAVREGTPLVSKAKDLFSEYNLYHGTPLAEIGGKAAGSLEALRALTGGDRHSLNTDPQQRGHELLPASPCIGAGELGGDIGAGLLKTTPLVPSVAELKVREITPRSASLTWWTPQLSVAKLRGAGHWHAPLPVVAELHYGTDRSCRRSLPVLGDLYHRASILDLRPETTYFCKVVLYEHPAMHGDQTEYRRTADQSRILYESEVLEFQTPSVEAWKPLRRTLYAATDGDSQATGESPENPTSLTQAAEEARAGDTVLLLPGIYNATFSPVASGVPGAPITLQAMRANTAIFDGEDFTRPSAVAAWRKEHLVIDGLVTRCFADLGLGSRAGMNDSHVFFSLCRNVEVRNSVMIGSGNYTKAVTARYGGDVVLRNNAFIEFPTPVTGRIIGTLTMEGNTWYHPLIRAFDMVAEKTVSHRNLFYGQNVEKMGRTPMVSPLRPTESDGNAFYFGNHERRAYIGYGLEAPAEAGDSLREVQTRLGLEQQSVTIPDAGLTFHTVLPRPEIWSSGREMLAFRDRLIRGESVPDLHWFTPTEKKLLKGAGADATREAFAPVE